MSDVKKISPVGSIHGWEESEFGEFVLSEDYDALEAEAQALREEVARLNSEAMYAAAGFKAAQDEVAGLRADRDSYRLERDLARHNFNDEKAYNYQLKGRIKELSARVVIIPDSILPHRERSIVDPGFNEALRQVKRLNGKAVSEGLLRRLLDSDGIDGKFDAQEHYAAHQELKALLGEGKEHE